MIDYRPTTHDPLIADRQADDAATRELLRPGVPGDDARSRAVGKPVGLLPGETLWEAFQRGVEGMEREEGREAA